MVHADETLIRIANAPTDIRWSRNERVTVIVGERTFAGVATLKIDTDQGSGRFYPDEGTAALERNWPVLETGVPVEPLGPIAIQPETPADWEVEALLLPGGNDNAGYFVEVRFTNVRQTRAGDAAYLRVLIRGQRIWHMPARHREQLSERAVRWHGNAHVLAFGRMAVLAQLRGEPPFDDVDQGQWLLGFAYRLPRLGDDELRSARLLIDLLAGTRGQPLLEEGFDADGNVVWRHHYNRAEHSEGQHLVLAPEAYDESLFDAFERYAGKVHDVMFVRQPPVWLDAVQHQLFAGDETNYPEIALAHYGIALDALIAMAVSQRGPFERMAMDNRQFMALLPPVIEAIHRQYSSFPEAATALVNRVSSANDRSVERTRRIFWMDIVHWTLTDEQLELFALRNTVVHHAHIPNARVPGGLQQVEMQMRAFRNLFAEAYFRYLGFSGAIRDAATPGATITIPPI